MKVKIKRNEREGPLLKREEKIVVPWYLPSGLFQARGKNRKNTETSEQAGLAARTSHTLVCLPGKAGAAAAQMTK